MNIVRLYVQTLDSLQRLVIPSKDPYQDCSENKISIFAFECLESLRDELLRGKSIFLDVEKFIEIAYAASNSPDLQKYPRLASLIFQIGELATVYFIKKQIDLEGFDEYFLQVQMLRRSLPSLNSESGCRIGLYLLVEKRVDRQHIFKFFQYCFPNGNLNRIDGFGLGLIHFAASEATFLPFLKLLIDGGLDLKVKSRLGATPLHYAASCSLEAVLLLYQKGLTPETDENDCLPIHWAASSGELEIVKKFIEWEPDSIRKTNITKDNLLFIACRELENLATVQFLASEGPFSHTINNYGITSFKNAQLSQNTEIESFLKERETDFFDFWNYLKIINLQFGLVYPLTFGSLKEVDAQLGPSQQCFESFKEILTKFSNQVQPYRHAELTSNEWELLIEDFNRIFSYDECFEQVDFQQEKRFVCTYIWEGSGVLSPGHMVGFIIRGDQLIICDRSDRTFPAKPGLVVYRIGNKENGKNLFKEISYLSRAGEAKKDFFFGLYQHLKLEELFYYQQKTQKHQDCSYLGLKGLLTALIYDTLSLKQLPVEEIKTGVKSLSKTLSRFHKQENLSKFIDTLKNVAKNPQLEIERNQMLTIGYDALIYILFTLCRSRKSYQNDMCQTILEAFPHLAQAFHSKLNKNLVLHACEIGDFCTVRDLITKFHVDLTVKGPKERNPLHMATAIGDHDIAELMIAHEPKLCNQEDGEGNTPLLFAVRNMSVAMVERLLRAGERVTDKIITLVSEINEPRINSLLEHHDEVRHLNKKQR